MPTADQHRVKAEGNRKFLATISLADHPDWVVVAAFYTALHVVERLRAASGQGHSRGHSERRTYIQHKHPEIHTHYHMLENGSLLARYESNADFFAIYQPDEITDRLIAQRLVSIEEYALARIAG